MKKILLTILAVLLFIPYILSYFISHLFKMKDRENMPTCKEWFDILKEV